MVNALVESEAVELLSRITGKKLSQGDITPPMIFLAALVTVLLGVILLDGTATTEKKQRLHIVLNRFVPLDADMRQLTNLTIRGVTQQQVYKKINELLTLTTSLSESEKLLLLSFGYEIPVTDGEIELRKKKYLEAVGKRLGIDPRHLAVLAASFSHQETIASEALDAVQSLLDPDQFQSLDAVFVKAANDMLVMFAKPEHNATQQHQAWTYGELHKFQECQKQLDDSCCQLSQIIQGSNDRSFLTHTLTQEIERVSQKLSSQRFRLAVVGEFSQGKSTLMNALLGEEIQPVRAIPCSGVVTVLKYGTQKRVVCCYKDGRQEEFPIEQYQVKAAISEEAALSSERDELSQSEIDEIIFEHPQLALCSAGVEIVDSPGLNECDDSTKITAQLLQDADAVILLTNASRPLTQWERDKANELRTKLNGGNPSEPADNLFVVVNFMDLLRREKDRQDVRQRIERFFQGQNPIVGGVNRVHFISAQAALDAILGGTENEYLKAFQNFTQAIEKFLANERGHLKIEQSVTKLNALIQTSLEGLSQAEVVLDGKLNLSEIEKQKILDQIGEVSGRDVKIRELAQQLKKQAIQQAFYSWQCWMNGLRDRIDKTSENWSSTHNPVWSQDKLIQDYVNQFTANLASYIDSWGNTQLKDVILAQNLEYLDANIYSELKAMQAELKTFDQQVQTHISEQLNLTIEGINDDFVGDRAFLGGIGIGGALAAALFFFTPVGWVSLIVASVVAALVGEFSLGMLGFDGIKNQVKRKVVEIGFKNFDEDKIGQKRDEIVSSVFDDRVESASRVIAQAILLYENLLEQQKKVHKETLEQREADKAWIAQKRQELEQVQKSIKRILKQCAK